jgi:hypothetical protein
MMLVLLGYPPKPLPGDDNDVLLTSLGVTSGAAILLKEDAYLKSAAPSKTKFLRKVIAADNSCLFNAIGYVLARHITFHYYSGRSSYITRYQILPGEGRDWK